LAARGIAYGDTVVFSGPIFRSKRVDGDRVILSFDHIGSGLTVKGGQLTGFEIAGEDGQYVQAEAWVDDAIVVVSSPLVERPLHVRFGWKNFPVVNLFNKEGLPASPFSTEEE
jgi:sialate O-acetylesterase